MRVERINDDEQEIDLPWHDDCVLGAKQLKKDPIMKKVMHIAIIGTVLSLFASASIADENNYNANANGNANSNGVGNANCNSALVQSCGAVYAAPAPVLGGGIALVIFGAALAGAVLGKKKNSL